MKNAFLYLCNSCWVNISSKTAFKVSWLNIGSNELFEVWDMSEMDQDQVK